MTKSNAIDQARTMHGPLYRVGRQWTWNVWDEQYKAWTSPNPREYAQASAERAQDIAARAVAVYLGADGYGVVLNRLESLGATGDYMGNVSKRFDATLRDFQRLYATCGDDSDGR